MKILAIDTASNVATAAVLDDEKLLGEYVLNHKRTHSQKIVPMIEELLNDLELTAADIDLFAAANGPGSFTGLRIGVATVKGLAHAVNKPVVGVSTLEGLAYNLPYAEHIIVPIMDARRRNVYTAAYIWDDGFKELGEPEAMSIEECADSCSQLMHTIFVGDGVDVYGDYLKERLGDYALLAPAATRHQRASSIAAAAMVKARKGEILKYGELVPFYLRKSQAEREFEKKNAKANENHE